ncbi:MAG: RsmB/NOP family class I SAM-dependent RNA methyltransferase [Lentisphaeria bacterium]|nr:RsmB/NOP family class I SAM-dependent RNA methyltransferase [Lentisphaeria bacterium]
MKRGTSGGILRHAAAGIAAVTERSRALDEVLDDSPEEFRRSVSHLLFNYFRYRRFVDSEVGAHLKKTPPPRLRALLRAAAAQLYFQSAIAPESAVNVAVDLAKRERAAGFVNAVLHRVLEHRKALPTDPEAILPDALLAAWRARFSPEELREQTAALLEEPRFAIRVCRDFPPPAGAETLPGWGGFRFFAADPAAVLGSAAFRRGEYYVQDPATSLAPSLPDYTQIASALELCAAPGGKTLMLAERLRPGARLVAADRSAKRQRLTRDNCVRHGVAAEVVTAEPPELEGSFDLVLADVPCGNSGVFRRRPDAMWRFSPERQRELVALQRPILDEAARLTAPGGQLVYSTCSIEPEENDLNVRAFLAGHPGFRLLKSRLLLPSPVNDGAFAALLIRAG